MANLRLCTATRHNIYRPETADGESSYASAICEVRKSAYVQVFGRRHDEPFHALWRPASKKRQGTKSREVGHWRGNRRYGDLIAAPSLRGGVTPTGCGPRVCA